MNIFPVLDKAKKQYSGLYPLYITPSGEFAGFDVSIGALGDSFYEYMLKLYLFTNKETPGYLRMYHESAQGISDRVVATSKSGYRYLALLKAGKVVPVMEHLV
jgi:hypothetical protein